MFCDDLLSGFDSASVAAPLAAVDSSPAALDILPPAIVEAAPSSVGNVATTPDCWMADFLGADSNVATTGSSGVATNADAPVGSDLFGLDFSFPAASVVAAVPPARQAGETPAAAVPGGCGLELMGLDFSCPPVTSGQAGAVTSCSVASSGDGTATRACTEQAAVLKAATDAEAAAKAAVAEEAAKGDRLREAVLKGGSADMVARLFQQAAAPPAPPQDKYMLAFGNAPAAQSAPTMLAFGNAPVAQSAPTNHDDPFAALNGAPGAGGYNSFAPPVAPFSNFSPFPQAMAPVAPGPTPVAHMGFGQQPTPPVSAGFGQQRPQGMMMAQGGGGLPLLGGAAGIKQDATAGGSMTTQQLAGLNPEELMKMQAMIQQALQANQAVKAPLCGA
jgi:hypothetical protein